MSEQDPGIRPQARGAEFPFGNKVARAAWQFAWLLLARWTPPPLHGWRRLVLKAFGAEIGVGARVYASVRIWQPRNLRVGDGAIIGPRVRIYNQGRIAIGAHAVISQEASICASTHDPHDRDFALLLKPVTIGEGCWVAAEAFVGPGVTMQSGAILGARGALFQDAEALTIYRGNPAEPIGRRTTG